jgi:4-phosphopantoate--beta-alanine ligase
MSRTARSADITIVDNVIRTLPIMVAMVKKLKGIKLGYREKVLRKAVWQFDNRTNLLKSESIMRGNLVRK